MYGGKNATIWIFECTNTNTCYIKDGDLPFAIFPPGVVIINPLAVYLDEHEAHTWQDTLQILGGLIAFVGIIHLIFLVRPILFKKTDNEYDVRKKIEY